MTFIHNHEQTFSWHQIYFILDKTDIMLGTVFAVESSFPDSVQF